jgi:hypothetical protein
VIYTGKAVSMQHKAMPKSQDYIDIFDRSFKLIIGSPSSEAVITLINALFNTEHPLDSETPEHRADRQSAKKSTTRHDSLCERTDYVVEEQTTYDANMAPA